MLSWLLAQAATVLIRYDRWTTARWLLELSLWWNRCWIAEPVHFVKLLESQPFGPDPVAANLRQLALLATKLNNQRLLTKFAAALSGRTFVARKLAHARGWERFQQRLKASARSLLIPTSMSTSSEG